MPQLEYIKAIARRFWNAADTPEYTSNEYFLPVMGLVFLRHAYSRYLAVKDDIKFLVIDSLTTYNNSRIKSKRRKVSHLFRKY